MCWIRWATPKCRARKEEVAGKTADRSTQVDERSRNLSVRCRRLRPKKREFIEEKLKGVCKSSLVSKNYQISVLSLDLICPVWEDLIWKRETRLFCSCDLCDYCFALSLLLTFKIHLTHTFGIRRSSSANSVLYATASCIGLQENITYVEFNVFIVDAGSTLYFSLTFCPMDVQKTTLKHYSSISCLEGTGQYSLPILAEAKYLQEFRYRAWHY